MKKILCLFSAISLLSPVPKSIQSCGAPQSEGYKSSIESKVSSLSGFLWKIDSKLIFNNENISKELASQFLNLNLKFDSFKKDKKLEKDYVYISEESFDDKNKFKISFKATYIDSEGLKKEELINARAYIDKITLSSVKNDINKFISEKEFNGGYEEVGKEIKKCLMELDSIKALVASTNNNFNINLISWDLYDKNSNIINPDRYVQDEEYSYSPAKIYKIKMELNSDYEYSYEFNANKKIDFYNITNTKNLVSHFLLQRSEIEYKNYTEFCDCFFKGERSLLFHWLKDNKWNLFFDMYAHLNNAPKKDYFLFKNCTFKIDVTTANGKSVTNNSFSFTVSQIENDINYSVNKEEWISFSNFIKDEKTIFDTQFYITGNEGAYIKGSEGYDLSII